MYENYTEELIILIKERDRYKKALNRLKKISQDSIDDRYCCGSIWASAIIDICDKALQLKKK